MNAILHNIFKGFGIKLVANLQLVLKKNSLEAYYVILLINLDFENLSSINQIIH